MQTSGDPAQSFRRKHQCSDYRAAKCLWHVKLLDAVVQGNGEFLCKENNRNQVQKQHHGMKTRRPHASQMTWRMLGRDFFYIKEVAPVTQRLDEQKDRVKQQRHRREKNSLFGGEGWAAGRSSEIWQHQTEHTQGHDHRSEEHTSELQSHVNLVCRLLLEK